MAASGELTPRPAPELPKIPGYRVEKVIGRGATGVVYRAVQLAVDRPVALKILHRELVGTKRAVRRLQREARTAARLSHPAIISAIDMGEVEGQWWFAMELVEGESLAQRLREQRRLSEREALRLFLPLCEGLQHAYEHGVVHRDVKPANILVDERGRARLVDLGLAFAESDPMLTSGGGTLGTPHYISPEQARDPASADARSDIWSLGATLFHALCGRPPFDGESVAEILSSVLYRPIQDPRDLAPGLSKGMALVVRKCLAREPSRRYQSPAELAADLERLRERRAPRVRAGSLDPLAKRAPRWVRPLALGAGAGLVATAAAFLAIQARTPRPDPAATLPTVAPEWPELAHLEDRLERGDIALAAAILRIESMQIPAELGLEVRRDALRTRAMKKLESELERFWVDARVELEARIARRDYDGASRWLAEGLSRELERRTGYAEPKELPARLLPLRDVREEWSKLVQESRRRATESAKKDLAQHVSVYVLPEVEFALKGSRWRDADALAQGAVDAWWSANAERVAGLGDAERQEIAASVAADLDAARARLRAEIETTNAALVTEVAKLAADLDAELRAGGRDVAARLREAFHASLERRGIDLAQLPEGVELPVLERLESAVAELAEAEREQVEADAARFFDESEQEVRALMGARRYQDAAEFWRARLEYDWLAPVRARIELRLRECTLLQGVLESAAEEIVRLDGKSRELYRSSTIKESGPIASGQDPLRRGFEHRTTARVQIYRLAPPAEGGSPDDALVARGDLEELAGLLASNAPEDRLALALFRFHEGDFAGAERDFPVLHRTSDPLHEDLRARIVAANRAVIEAVEERRSALEYRQRAIEQLYGEGDTREAVKEINRTLEQFADLLDDASERRLKALRETLQQAGARPELQDVFGPDALERGPQARGFSMRWRFDADGPRAWKLGRWEYDGDGWSLPHPLPSDKSLFDFGSSPQLALDPPIDLDEALHLRVVLERLDPEVARQTVVLSLRDFHLGLLVDGTHGYWLIDTTSGEDVLERLRRPEDARRFTPYEAGQPFVIELRVHRGIDELVIGGKRFDPPSVLGADPDERRVVLRARERVRVLTVELSGKER